MATSYPGSLDNFTNPTSTSPINSPSHADQHSNANDAIEAIEGELGTNPKGAKATVKARLDDVDTAIALKAPIASPTFTGTVTIPAGSAITGVPYLATANTFTGGVQQITTASDATVGLILKRGTSGQTANIFEIKRQDNNNYVFVDAAGFLQAQSRGLVTNTQVGGGTSFTVQTGFASSIPLLVKAAASQTADLQQWQDSAGNVLASLSPVISSNVSLKFTDAYSWSINWGSRPILSTASGYLTITPYDDSRIALTVKGYASQTANLQEWQGSGGNALTVIDAYGALYLKDTAMIAPAANWAADRFAPGGLTIINRGTASQLPFGVRGAASQTANLQEWQNSAGTVVANIKSDGAFKTGILQTGQFYTLTDTGPYLLSDQYGWSLINRNIVETNIFTIKGMSGQTGNLQEWRNSANTVLVKIAADGSTTFASPIVGFVGNSGSYSSTAVSGYNIIHLSQGMILINSQTGGDYNLATNAYYNSGWKYFESTGSTLINFGNGRFDFNTASSGTAGNAITYTSKMIIANSGTVTINGFGAGSQGLIVKGAASQTANLQEWQNSAGTVIANITPAGKIAMKHINGISGDMLSLGSNGASDILVVGYDNISAATYINGGSYGPIQVQLNSAANGKFVIKGAASQTADLQQWQNSSGTVLVKINSTGQITSLGSDHYFSSSAAYRPNIHITNTTADSNGSYILFEKSRAGSVVVANDVLGVLNFTGFDTATYAGSAIIYGVAEGTFSPTSRPGKLVFATVPSGSTTMTDRMTIANSGTVTINGFGAAAQGLIIKSAASQSVNIFEVQNSGGYPMVYVDAYGALVARASGMYVDSGYSSGIGLQVRGVASQTADLQQWQNNAVTVLAKVNNYGGAEFIDLKVGTTSSLGVLSVTPGLSSQLGIIVRGRASQTADLQQWQDSAGNVAASINSGGSLSLSRSLYTSASLGVWASVNADPQGGSTGNALTVQTYNTTSKGIVIVGQASQTANLQEWQNSSGTVLASISSAGKLTSAVDASINGLTFGLGASAVSSNVAAGSNALATNSTGLNNSALGYQALYLNTTGAGNSAFGYISLTTNTSGYNNSAFGTQSLTGNTTGINNTAIGAFVLKSNTTGSDNSSFGINSLYTNTTGAENTAIGANSLYLNTIGIGNSAFGKNSLYSNTTGSSNVGIGYSSIYANTTGSNHVAVGYQALYSNTSGIENSVLGYQALYANTTGSGNTGFGTAALYSNTGGYNNTAVASKALYSNTNGIQNVAIGQRALYTNTTGGNNTAIGMQSGYLNVTGSSSVFIGYQAGYNETGSNKLYIANTDTATPLIGGDFSAKTLTVAGNAAVVSQATGTPVLIVKGTSGQQQYFSIQDSSGSAGIYVDQYMQMIHATNTYFNGIYNNSGNWSINNSGSLSIKQIASNISSTVSINTASTIDTVALSSFTSMEYTLSIKQGSKIRSSKVLVHTDGTSVDSTEYGIMEMGGGITGILVTASVSSTNAILQVTITDAATTNATVKLIKTML